MAFPVVGLGSFTVPERRALLQPILEGVFVLGLQSQPRSAGIPLGSEWPVKTMTSYLGGTVGYFKD